MTLAAIEGLDRLSAEHRHEVEQWMVRKVGIAGGPSMIVVRDTNYEPAISLREALEAVDEAAWARRAELRLDDERVLVLSEKRAWLSTVTKLLTSGPQSKLSQAR